MTVPEEGTVWHTAVWGLLCRGVLDLGDDFDISTGFVPGYGMHNTYTWDGGSDVEQDVLLDWLQALPGARYLSSLEPRADNHPFDDLYNIRRHEASTSFVKAFRLNPSAFGLPTGFSDVDACENAADNNCHESSRHVRALHACRFMAGYTSGNADDPGTFLPDEFLPRGQAALVMWNFLDVGCVDLRVESVTVDRVAEGETATVTVKLSRPVGALLGEFDHASALLFFDEGTATEDVDYVPPSINDPFLGLLPAFAIATFRVGGGDTWTETVDALVDTDASEGDETYIVRIVGDGIPSDVVEVTAVIEDGAAPGVVIDPTTVTVNEGGTRTYQMKLTAQPSGPVLVTINDPTDNTDVTALTASLSFTDSNWDTDQWVTVRSAQDTVTESDETATITHTVTSTDAVYDGIAADDVTVDVIDDDTAGVVITPTSLTIDEGGTGTYRVRLGAQPSASVLVTINDPTDNTDVAASPSVRSFTTLNWDRDQTVSVRSTQDTILETNETATVTHTVTSSDSAYNNISTSDVAVSVTDNDSPGVILTPASDTIDEGDYDLYYMELASQPSASVTVTANDPTDNNDVIVVGAYSTRTFTTSNWATGQYVVYGSIQDTIYEAGGETATISHTVTSADSDYNGVSVSRFVVTVDDDDPAPIVVITGVDDPTVHTPPPAQSPVCASGWHQHGTACRPNHRPRPTACAQNPQSYTVHVGGNDSLRTEPACPPQPVCLTLDPLNPACPPIPPTCTPFTPATCPPLPPVPTPYPECPTGFHLNGSTCYQDHDTGGPCRFAQQLEWVGWSGHPNRVVLGCPLPVPYDTSLLVNTAGGQLTLRLQVDVASSHVESARMFRVSATSGSAVNGTHFDLPTQTLTFNSANPTHEIEFDTHALQSHGLSPRSFTIVVQDTHSQRGHARITLAPRINPPAIGRQ